MGCTTLRNPMKTEAYQGTDDRHLGMCSLDILGRCCRNWLCYMYLCLEVLLGWPLHLAKATSLNHRFILLVGQKKTQIFRVFLQWFQWLDNGWTWTSQNPLFPGVFWSQAWNADPSPRSYRYNSAVCHGSGLGCTVPWDCNKWFFSLTRTINGEWIENGIAWVLYGFVLFSLQFEVLWALFSENFGSYVYIYIRIYTEEHEWESWECASVVKVESLWTRWTDNFAIHFPQLWPTVYMGVSENVVYRHIAILVGMAINRQISKLF